MKYLIFALLPLMLPSCGGNVRNSTNAVPTTVQPAIKSMQVGHPLEVNHILNDAISLGRLHEYNNVHWYLYNGTPLFVSIVTSNYHYQLRVM